MTTWLDTGRARDWTHEYLDTIPLEVLINNYCYGKSQMRIARDFLFVGLRKKLNSLTSRFRQVSCRYVLCITIHDETKSRIICLAKPKDYLSFKRFSVTYEKDTTKDSEAKPLIKLYQSKPNQEKSIIWNGALPRNLQLDYFNNTLGNIFWTLATKFVV